MSIPPQEYLDRIARFAALMRTERIDGAVLTGESNIDYFSGFRHHAPWTLFARPFLEVISADGRAALITHGFLEGEMRRMSPVADIRVFTQSGGLPLALLMETLKDFGIEAGRIGAELGYEQRIGVSFNDFVAFRDALAGEIVDVSRLVWRLRMIKSPAERDLMRHAAEITRLAMEAAFAAARAGVSEREVARVAGEAMMRHGAEKPGFVLVASGADNYGFLSRKATDRKLEAGDMLWLDMGTVYEGYWSDFCRAGVVEGPSPEQEDLQKVILEVNQACLEAVRPGEPVKRVAEAAEATFARLGHEVRLGEGRIGHGMGLMSTEPPHVALYEDTVMTEGLVFTIEPRITSRAGVFNVEEIFAVTAQGADVLTTAGRDLRTLAA